MEKKCRLRAPNFTPAETLHLCDVLSKYKNVIENKKTDGATLQDKNNAWQKVLIEYNATTPAYQRTVESLQQCYKNVKKKAKKQHSNAKMCIAIPEASTAANQTPQGHVQDASISEVDNVLLLESIQENKFDWRKVASSTGTSEDICKQQFKTLEKDIAAIDVAVKKDVMKTGGGPPGPSSDDNTLIYDKVKNLIGPTFDGFFTVYDGDAELMSTQDIAPIEESFFSNNRANLKRKPNPILQQPLTSTPNKKAKSKTVSEKFKTLADSKMELVELQKELVKYQIEVEKEKLKNWQLQNNILKKKTQEEEGLQ